ncbi:type II toxin-antitoxin system VapC family toxin [Scytonema hofmannii FACHB-248]|uniref:Type II toxin-antitoxin system VapC family toxin n=1 Tax=Scytonema hofmannii FACHB-248 TaxID=1842502 RepID=A0ABR8GN89_9CYAN|nr:MULTISPECIES: type II toxin-antitoxin system VapC family toxin [Nostocales]MBD2604664.1 type II toxin-antitoxin system VapC family toxin [Scytonema hofmannii FACHB-248]
MYLLDTDTLTYLYAGNANVIARLKALENSEVGITIITKAEMLRGRIDYLLKAETGESLLRAQELLFRTEELLGELLIVPVSQSAADEFERLRIVSKLRKIGRADLLIASISLANRATLVTRNIRHFKQIPGLRVVNWVD